MLRGRRPEQETVDALLDRARDGVSGALVIRGEPGIGKSALLAHAAARAGGMRVLRGGGVESEAALPFAGLHLLLRPAMDLVGTLPGPQRRALTGAFGIGEGGGDRFLVGAGVLSLLAAAAETQPLLCLVDDAHWLDRPSVEALLFAARRLDREGIALVFALRDHDGTVDAFRDQLGGLPEMRLSGLDAESAAALLADTGVALSASQRERLVTETGGNPLALIELPPLVAAQGVPSGPLPLTGRVIDAFRHQLGGLPAASRTLLLIAAADDTGSVPVLLRAAQEVGVGVADLQPAETQGLVSVTAGALAFRHPLIRSALYHRAPLGDRVAAHTALASAYAEDPDRRAWHLALAATGTDETVAAELEAAARRAEARAGHAAAAVAYERAAQLSPDPRAAARRRTLGCETAMHSSQLAWARRQAERAAQDVGDAHTFARLADVRAIIDFVDGDLESAHRLFTDGAAAIADEEPDHAFWMLVRALHSAWATPSEKLIADSTEQFAALGIDGDSPLAPVMWVCRWSTAATLQHDTSGFPPLAAVFPAARAAAAAAGPPGLIALASRALVTGCDEEYAEISAGIVTAARATGMLNALPAGRAYQALAHVLLGRYREGLITATEALTLGRDTDQPLWTNFAAGVLAFRAAVLGDEPECRRHAADLDAARTEDGSILAGTAWARAATALLDLGLGRVQDAFDQLEAAAAGPGRHLSSVLRTIPDHVEAAVRLGEPGATAAPLARFRHWAAGVQQPWIDAQLARCAALVGPDAEADEHYRRALALHERAPRPFDRARTELLYGEWLRRARRKTEARRHLGRALAVFDEIGSAPWSARARGELAALGAGAPQLRTADVFAELTPQELQIARLAAQGLSNRDIAAQLFLSPRTIAYHLYKAYPKLGVASRSELAALVRDAS